MSGTNSSSSASASASIPQNLKSAGVQVTIVAQPYYASGSPTTIPLIVFATQANKPSPTTSGTVAPYTAPQNSGVLFYATSQRELIQNFGYPLFTTSDGSVIQGDELNEYGLHAAYTYLGISNAAYVLRADIDLGELIPSATAPVGAPINGTYWFDLATTAWGLFVSNGASSPGSAWTSAPVIVPNFTQTAAVGMGVGETGATALTGYIAGTTLTLTTGTATLVAGQYISGPGVTLGTQVTVGGNSSTSFTVSASQTVGSSGSPVSMSASGSQTNIVYFLEPASSFGAVGNYAVMPWDVNNFIYQNFSIAGIPTWVRIGSTYLTGMTPYQASRTWTAQFPNIITATVNGSITNGYVFSINGVSVSTSGGSSGGVAGLVNDINTALGNSSYPFITASVSSGKLVITNNYGTGLNFAEITTPSGQTIGPLELIGITAAFAAYQSVPGKINTTSTSGTANPQNVASLVGQSIYINGVEITFSSVSNFNLLTAVTQINTALGGALFNTYQGGTPSYLNGIPTNLISGIYADINNFGAIRLTNVAATNGIPGIIVSDVSGGTVTSVLGLTTGYLKPAKVVRNSNASYPANSSTGDLWVKGNPANTGATWVVNYYNSTTGAFTALTAPFFPFNSRLQDGNVNKDAAAIAYFTANGGTPNTGTVYIGYDASADSLGTNGGISAGGVQQIRIYTGTGFAQSGEVNPPYSGYQTLEYEADFIAPTTNPAAGVYWYNNNPSADIMVSDGTQWLGYRVFYPNTDSNGPIISGSAPTQQLGGHTVNGMVSYALADNDLWIDSSDTENYPAIYTYSSSSQSWTLIDNTDHTTPFGIVFGDARQDSGVAYAGQPLLPGNISPYNYNSTLPADMTLSSFVDPDSNNEETIAPYLYPDGMLLFNTRYSTGNVKVYQPTYFNAGTAASVSAGTNYSTTDYTVNSYNAGTNTSVTFPPTTASRWVTASGNTVDTNVPYMLRKAQRIMVVQSLAEQINTNQDILSELIHFNLIAVPGYPELMPDMMSLNIEQKQVSLCVADTPIRLAASSSAIQTWAQNSSVPAPGEDGLGTFTDDYTALYYPWGLGQNYNGVEVMIPPSTIALRVMAYNDQVSFPWFAPAGFTRGLVTNATSVGYLTTGSGEAAVFQPVILNQGQRDTLYENNINPIAYIPTRGLVVFGQKTLSGDGTILNRVNIVRLVNYIAYNLDIITKPYLFEQNDQITQKAAGNTVSRFLNALIGQRALYDYAVLCDSTNNTPERVNLNQLWIDVLVQPIEAVEFIYIPVRVVAQGDSNTLNT